MRPVTLQFYKYPSTPHWRHEMLYLGDDDHGTWLGAPMGTVIQRGSEPAIIWNRPFVQLIQPEEPWIPIWNVAPDPTHRTAIYVDITTVPTMPTPDRVEAIDVDLDVVLLIDGSIEVLDEDEFEEHRAQLSYPDWLVDQARASAASVAVAIDAKKPPFNGAHLSWFEVLATVESD